MKSTKKINSEFATAPAPATVDLFSITNGNEFKIINYLINLVNSTNNNTVSVSYSQLMKDCNIICNKTIKRAIDNLIKLGLISKVSGNGNTNNSYTINFDYIKFDYINEFGDEQTIDLPIK